MPNNTIGTHISEPHISIPISEQTSPNVNNSRPLTRSGLSGLNSFIAKNTKHIATAASVFGASGGAISVGFGMMRAGIEYHKDYVVVDSNFFTNVFTTKDLIASLSMGLGTISLIGGIYGLRKLKSHASDTLIPQHRESIPLEQLPAYSAQEEEPPRFSEEEQPPHYSSENQTGSQTDNNNVTISPSAHTRD